MKTKRASRSAKSAKKPTSRPQPSSVRARATKVSSTRTAVKKAAPKKAAAKPKASATTTASTKYGQAGAPWWKAFL